MKPKDNKDSLGARMKSYESVPKNFLMSRTPVLIRLDGRAFHTFTKRSVIKQSLVTDPFSHVMHDCMTSTTMELCKQIQNVKLAYTQSDEITLLLTDWDTLETQQWFNGNIQKITSLSAAIATNAFNAAYRQYEQIENCSKLPTFDSRVFNMPKEDVVNMLVWRQQDATRNSVNMLAQYHFSHKELQGKRNNEMQDMLMLGKGVNWNDIDTWKKRGSCVVRVDGQWVIDDSIPIFTQDREYIQRFVA